VLSSLVSLYNLMGNTSQTSPDIVWAHHGFFSHKNSLLLLLARGILLNLMYLPLLASLDQLKGSELLLVLFNKYIIPL